MAGKQVNLKSAPRDRRLLSAATSLTFAHPVPGSLTIGVGQHCGFGRWPG